MKSTNLSFIITFITIFIGHMNALSAGEMFRGLRESQTLTQQATQVTANQILDFYKKDASTAFDKTEKYLKDVPWDIQLMIFDTLIKTLPATPAYYNINNEIVLNVEQPTNKATRPLIAKLLLDLLNSKKMNFQKIDLANLIFTGEAHLFPGSTAIISTFETKQFDKLEELLKYASINARLNSIAFYILSRIYKTYDIRRKQAISNMTSDVKTFTSSFLYGIAKLINYGLLHDTLVAFRYPLIHQIDEWINSQGIKIIPAGSDHIQSYNPISYTPIKFSYLPIIYIPVQDIDLEELRNVRALLLRPYPQLKSCTVQ